MSQNQPHDITIQAAQEVFAAASLHRLCSVIAYPSRTDVPVQGTGTVVRHREELFVVTCAHVARDFFAMHGGELLFRRLPKVPRSSCALIYSHDQLDLAVIHIQQAVGARLASVRPLLLADLGGEREFQRAKARRTKCYMLAGFPGALAVHGPEKHRIELSPMIFGTTVRRRSGLRLELAYDHAIQDGKLIAAHGLSGALVFEVPEPQGDALWNPGMAVGVQHAWNEVKRVLVCSPVEPCVEAIRSFCGRTEMHA